MYKKDIDFISVDTIKQALSDTMGENIQCIYLTGAEPMTHPDFNSILRLCLEYCNVCICTNGSFINEKKARFIKKVEDESENEVIFRISIDHYDEIKNDDIRYRGAYRHAVFAIKHLVKYGFNPIICVTNYYNLSEEEIYKGFWEVFKHNNIDLNESNLHIIPYHNKSQKEDEILCDKGGLWDCSMGRILTNNGVYSCPFLSNDYRGRCGSNFSDYSKKCALETNFCITCSKSLKPIFSIDYTKFEQ
jgi:molybdenum cofactor biosynthesis enzyme MoaA